jgi:protein arginine kinase activator
MKCQFCEKPATFHITELTEPNGPQVMHLCEEHARGFLQKEAVNPAASVAGALAKQLNLGQTKAELAELDQKECPVCGISFFEFRNTGRLGCPYDYTHFADDLQPLLINIHDSLEHQGKRPRRAAAAADSHAQMIQLRREMEEAVDCEDYERASEIRDELKQMEEAGRTTVATGENASGGDVKQASEANADSEANVDSEQTPDSETEASDGSDQE